MKVYPSRVSISLLIFIILMMCYSSSPAASLSRICLDVKGGPDVLLSPRYQQDFLEEIKKINPDVKIDERLLSL